MNIQAIATPARIQRTEADYSRIAGESVKVEFVGSFIHAFGSELGTLRLKNKMGMGKVEYSKNLRSWVYSFEAKI